MASPFVVGVLPLGRNTFDVELAENKVAAMWQALRALPAPDGRVLEFVGPSDLLFDADTTREAITELRQRDPDALLILQVTFTDAAMTLEIAESFECPLSIWAVPEPREGGRLRLNSFCGLNLASHALGRNGRTFGWLYADPSTDCGNDLAKLISGERQSGRLSAVSAATDDQISGQLVCEKLRGRAIAKIGEHPDGFTTCQYDASTLEELSGVTVQEFSLNDLFDAARAVDADRVSAVREIAADFLSGLDDVDQGELDRSLRLKSALDDLRQKNGADAFAIRCWPETFTEYGGAICGPVSMQGEARVPCACEADVYGALTQMILQEVCDAPVFLTDLVDMDVSDNSGVIWHCGQAPKSMCDPNGMAEATIHTNRRMPLLYQFALKPGRVTMMRISQAFNETKMIIATGNMLRRPMAFTGTSGIVEFDAPVSSVLPKIMDSGLEHHMALAYGDHRDTLLSVARAMDLPVLDLTA